MTQLVRLTWQEAGPALGEQIVEVAYGKARAFAERFADLPLPEEGPGGRGPGRRGPPS